MNLKCEPIRTWSGKVGEFWEVDSVDGDAATGEEVVASLFTVLNTHTNQVFFVLHSYIIRHMPCFGFVV
jgi:hypothetical protein